jgi:hypothetical protein
MTDIIKGISGENRFLVMTEQDARQIMSSAPNLNFYRCQQMGEFDAVLDSISAQPKIELCHKLQIGLSTYDSFLIEQFKADILHMYFTGTSHYTASSNKLAESSDSTFYLVPAIYGLEYSGVNFFNLTSNPEASKQYIDRFDLDEMKVEQLVYNFYANAGSMYKNGAPMFPLPKHYENHLVKMLVDGDAIIIEKSKSLFTPFVEMFSSAKAVGTIQSNKIDDTCQPFGLFVIRCEHYPNGRKFQLDVLNTDVNFNDNKHVLQVIAQTGKPEKIAIEYEKAGCTNGDDECYSLIIDSSDKKYNNKKIKLSSKGPYDLSVEPNVSTYPEDSEGNPIMKLGNFMKDFLIPTNSITNPNIYTVTTHGCKDITSNTAAVHCYPAMAWEGEIIAGRTAEIEKNFSFKYDKDNQLETAALPPADKTSFTYGGEISVNINNRKFTPVKYSRSIEGDSNNFILKKIEDTVSGLLDSIDLIDTIGKKIGVTPVKFTIKPPSIAIGGGMKAVEHPTSGVIDYEGSIYLKAKPLLSIEFEIDFFNILIIMAGGATAAVGGPAAAKFIIEMREKFKTGVGSSKSAFEAKGDFHAKLTIIGDVGGSLIWTSNPGEKIVIEQGQEEGALDDSGKRSTYTKGELVGKVGITLKAGAYAEGRLLKISVKAGISIGASGAKATTDPIGLFVTLAASSEENKPTLSGNVEFSGFQIYYIKFAEMSRKEGVNADDANSGKKKAGGGFAKKTSVDPKLEDAKTLYTVIKDRKLWEFGEGETSAPQTLTQV